MKYKIFHILNNFINKGEGKKIIELNKRALNIVIIEGKKVEINNFIDTNELKNYKLIETEFDNFKRIEHISWNWLPNFVRSFQKKIYWYNWNGRKPIELKCWFYHCRTRST